MNKILTLQDYITALVNLSEFIEEHGIHDPRVLAGYDLGLTVEERQTWARLCREANDVVQRQAT